MNALKHGIFSSAILNHAERKADYERLVEELQQCLRPEGTLEKLLVEKLASLLWRHRRLLTAESAEITKRYEVSESRRLRHEAFNLENRAHVGETEEGLMAYLDNPFVIDRCIELLQGWRQRLQERGYEALFDRKLLHKLWGRPKAEELDAQLQERLKKVVTGPPPSRHAQAPTSLKSELCKEWIDIIDQDIELLDHNKALLCTMAELAKPLDGRARLIPRGEALDRLIRYEAHLSREFARTLSQLERMQRMRLGKAVLPPVQVEISS